MITKASIIAAGDCLKQSFKKIMAGDALTVPWPDSEDSRFRAIAKLMLEAAAAE